MTTTRPRVCDHLERMRASITALRTQLKTMSNEELIGHRVPLTEQLDLMDDEIDAAEKVMRDIVCDANATLDRIM